MIDEILNNKVMLVIVGALLGTVSTIAAHGWLNRRALFTYSVVHAHIGMSTEDAIYGSVRITWNNNPVAHLYVSTVELTNQSVKDFESITVRAFSHNTLLLGEKTEVIGTTRILEHTKDYKSRIAVAEGEQPTEFQFKLYGHQREYFVPTMNRGQSVRFEFLNAPSLNEQPSIWLDILEKGVQLKFTTQQGQFAGVPQPTAALARIIREPEKQKP